MHFLCDATDLNQSVEGALKVYGKSLTTVLCKVYLIVNLHSFPLLPVTQANPFLMLSHLLPPSQNTSKNWILLYFYKLPRAYFSPECLLNFLSNVCIPQRVGKMFKFIEFKFLENVLIQGIFTHAPPHSKIAPPPLQVLVITPWTKINYSFPYAVLFRKSVCPSSRKGRRKLLYTLSKISQKI